MPTQRQNMIVGLFALVGLVVMCVLIVMFGGGQMLFASTYDIRVHFPEGVVGVQAGQGVTFYGKRVGETKKMEFWADEETGELRPELGVVVIVAVDGQYDLPASSRVRVAASIMGLGRPAIMIEADEPEDPAKLARDGQAVIPGAMIATLDQVLPVHMQQTLTQATADIGTLAAALTPVAEHLARLLETRDVQTVDLEELTANLDTVIQRFDSTLRNINVVVGDEQNQENLKVALANLREMSEVGPEFMTNVTEIGRDGKQLVKNADELVRTLVTAADDLSSMLKRADQALAMLTEGDGSAALLLRDNRLYEELVLTSRRMTKALDDIREVVDQVKKGKSLFSVFP